MKSKVSSPRSIHTDKSTTPVGAAMVVGGGIAGMQASLDLADQGFKVYLVEKQSAIGGKMAQLDKTFPTNDCAMCTISPKLVETGRHPNIEILTNTEVLEVSGDKGNFTVRLRQEPRYIEVDQCVACNDCAEVCPVIIPDPFNEALNSRHAAYKQYPQAVPNAYAIQKAGVAPCRDGCPAGQRAQGYIALIREGRWEDALRVIKMDNPFPGICGRICNHRCEEACNRAKLDEPINIRALKRFVTDKVYEKPRQPLEPVEINHPDKRVAIIGAGPCGLTAAQDIIRNGYPVTVFEALPVAGGMLRVGVPEYRLPSEIVEREVRDIVDLGVDLQLNHRVDDFDEIFDQGYTAVLIAVGAHEGVRPPIPGANQDGVLVSTTFLRDVRISDPPALGERVVVVGAGDVAMDVARTAVRLGSEVHIFYRRRREDATADEQEIQHAQEEGVVFHFQTNIKEIIGDSDGLLKGITCFKTEPGTPDKSGRPKPVPVPESETFFPCENVIFAVGQRAGLAFIPDDAGVGITDQQTIAINPNTFAATREGVFAAGDSISGTSFVIDAVASGHTAAQSMIRYLQAKHLEPPRKPNLPVVELSQKEIDEKLARGEVKRQPRVPIPELAADQRVNSFEEVSRGYDEESARAEAARCLACGICSECMSCVFECGRDAIDHDMVAKEKEVNAGAIILAPGYQTYQAELSEEFGFGRYPNVVTSMQFERLLSASGPTMGTIQRPSDDETPRRIAFLQCVGSRDQEHDYCSSVCCMYATKESVVAKEHDPDLDIHVFLMDMRAFSKGYLRYFQRAQDDYGIHYHHCRISDLHETSDEHDLILRYTPEENPNQLVAQEFDLVVLSVGMEMSESVQTLGRQLGVSLDEYGFCSTPQFNPVESSRAGIYAVGPFREPKDIPEAVMEASGASGAVGALLGSSRHSLTTIPEFPPERDISEEEPRIGVFVCHCGSNIGGYLDVPKVADYAASLPHVEHAEENLYTCSQDSIKHITETVKEENLNRVVVASCTPLTHAPLFQDSIRAAGLNPYLFEMANIRNQCSWVHSHDWDTATEKAQELVHMAVARSALLNAQPTIDVPVENEALVVGGGVAGMTAALTLAENGFPVHLVEKEAQLGGHLRDIHTLHDNRDAQQVLRKMFEQVESQTDIHVHLESTVQDVKGFRGNFSSTIESADGQTIQVSHGATILATGAQEYRGEEYGYGQSDQIITQQELEAILGGQKAYPTQEPPDTVVMIQCIGPAEQYCSRICCTVALKNALKLKEQHPDTKVIILYKDMRVYGFKERLYSQARQKGILFLRYNKTKPKVESIPASTTSTDKSASLRIQAWDPSLERTLELPTDLLVLSMPVVPNPDTKELANCFKVSTDADGFFMEAHVKLRPVDFATEGVFMAGMAHYPKLVDEAMIQAQAAASRAARLLSKKTSKVGGRVAVVEPELCTGCLTCVRACPFDVPLIKADLVGIGNIQGAAYIEAAICQGCGSCAAACPAQAIQLMHYTDAQMAAKVSILAKPKIPAMKSEEVGA